MKGVAKHAKNMPIFFISFVYSIFKKVNNAIRVEKADTTDRRIRYPRYFSYTKELEPYSAQKAFAVQIMRYNENVINIYSLHQTEVIFTENRILCVKLHSDDSETIEHWSLLFTDILNANVSLSLFIFKAFIRKTQKQI